MPRLKLPLVLFQKSFNYGLILTFFGFTKWGGGFCVCVGAEAGVSHGSWGPTLIRKRVSRLPLSGRANGSGGP